MGFDAGHQFARAEGLGDVVVATDFEAEDAVDFVGAGGQEYDRYAREASAGTKAAAQFEAVMAGEHDVENDQIRAKAFERRERAILASENSRLETRTRQVVFDQRSEFGFIFDYGYAFGHGL